VIEEAEEETAAASKPTPSEILIHNMNTTYKHIVDAKIKEEMAGFTLKILRA
jgi:hypothetical protein